LSFQIHTIVHGKNIQRTILDEGYSTCVMYFTCWRAIGSPDINESPTTLNTFEVRDFKPYGLLHLLAMELGGNIVSIDVEVVDTPLEYNLLSSSIFLLVQFPHQGKIVTIDQLNYCTLNIHNQAIDNIPILVDSKVNYESVRGRYP
jgi:hypothetical protein